MEIIWSPFAQENLKEFYNYTLKNNPQEYIKELVLAVDVLKISPNARQNIRLH